MPREVLTKSAAETKKLGANLAKKILKGKFSKKSFIIALEGELGSGKTTFLQGFAKGLGIKEKILSPTFVIMKKFSAPGGPASGWRNFYHIDCYRLHKPKEILDLGFKEIIESPKNIVAIEWAERVRKILPKKTPTLKFIFINNNKRKVEQINLSF